MKSTSKEIYLQILKSELIPALGCTEPIAVAYAAAKARAALGELPCRAIVSCSGNIVKNVKGVIVPTTKDMKGMASAAAIGITGGDPDLDLEVLSKVDDKALAQAKALLKQGVFEERVLDSKAKLHIIVELFSAKHRALVEIIHTHTGIVRIEKDDKVLLSVPHTECEADSELDYAALNLKEIYHFARNVELEAIRPTLDQQINYNTAISREGLKNDYGAGIGKTLLEMYGEQDLSIRAAAMAAAGSDARMSGCEMPVVINSGSGNQGITVSLPVIVYAQALKKTPEELYRALCFANLVAIYQKSKIGRLSAFCGAVNAATGAGAGIAFLLGMDLEQIGQVIINSLAGVSGIVCDGAKPSCAAKINAGVQAATMAVHMVQNGRGFRSGDGLVKESAEATLTCISSLAKDGMEVTDRVILALMVPEKAD